jgi:phage recombination protein Bet
MASKYSMTAANFEATVRNVCMRPAKDAPEYSREEFAAFLLVCRNYDLNPLLGEIYAFRKRGGGFQSVVGVDGWVTLINRQPQLDGIEFEYLDNEDGTPNAVTCRIWRKDRSRPVEVTEYLAECVRNSDAWRTMPRRSLRHKAMIQAARYAFGFVGIVEPDEVADSIHPEGPLQIQTQRLVEVPTEAPRPPTTPPRQRTTAAVNPEDWLAELKDSIDALVPDDLVAGGRFDQLADAVGDRRAEVFPPDFDTARRMLQEAELRLSGAQTKGDDQ